MFLVTLCEIQKVEERDWRISKPFQYFQICRSSFVMVGKKTTIKSAVTRDPGDQSRDRQLGALSQWPSQ